MFALSATDKATSSTTRSAADSTSPADDRSQELYNRFLRLFPEPFAGGSGQRNRTFYTPGNHDVALEQNAEWKDPQWWKLYWTIQTREFSRWKFKELFGTTVADLGWNAEPLYPPNNLSHHLVQQRADPAKLRKYGTKEDHTYRKAMSARVPLQAAHSDGSAPSRLAELVLLDTTDILAMQRMGRDPFTSNPPASGEPGKEADWRPGGAWWFLNALDEEEVTVPRILMTHVPLWRDSEATCSVSEGLVSFDPNTTLAPGVRGAPRPAVHRLSSTRAKIVPGSDAPGTYENLVGVKWSRFILERAKPSAIFTGDDHDVCYVIHPRSQSSSQKWSIPELTVPAMGLTSGVSHPGYARIAIWSQQGKDGALQTQIEYAACDLPDQVHIWATSYPLLIVSLLAALLLRRWWTARSLGRTSPVRKPSFLRSRNCKIAGQHGHAHHELFVLESEDEDELVAPLQKDTESVLMTQRSNHGSSSGSSAVQQKPNVSNNGGGGQEALRRGDTVDFDYDIECNASAFSPPSLSPSPDADNGHNGSRRGDWRDLVNLSFIHRRPIRATSRVRASGHFGGYLSDGEHRRPIYAQFLTVAWPVFAFWLLLFIFGF